MRADVETLRRLHVAHRKTFLFETLASHRRRLSVAPDDIERKFLDDEATVTRDWCLVAGVWWLVTGGW